MLADSCSMSVPGRMTEATATTSEDSRAIERFLREIERRALRMAEFATSNREEALDLVQDAMFGFVRNYATRAHSEWAPLFWRVLDSRIHDWRRRQRVRGHWLGWFDRGTDKDEDDPIASVADQREPGPLARLADDEASAALEIALRALPLRQRQAFLLRLWEGLDVAATATSMRCSEGSVKTHLSRALANLRNQLEAHQ
ncbi:MAG: RNA polymerase sigma factor [Lysobacterales bacterium]